MRLFFYIFAAFISTTAYAQAQNKVSLWQYNLCCIIYFIINFIGEGGLQRLRDS